MRSRATRTCSEGGFTIIEVLAAMVVLLVGLGGALKVYDGVATTASAAKLREQGVSLQRELVEGARSLKYADLAPGIVVPKLQAQPGLADASAAPGWQLRRRGVTYTVAVGACSVDDPRDSTGPHATSTFCLTGAGTTTHERCTQVLGSSGSIQGAGGATAAEAGDCGLDANLDGQVDSLGGGASGTGTDTNAEDYKRVVVLVRWTNGNGSRYVLQDSIVPSPGAADAVLVSALSVSPTTVPPGHSSVTATATTDRPAATVSWSIDGELGDTAAMSGSGTSWSYTWQLGPVTARSAGSAPAPGEVVDGAYVLSARAFDQYGQVGPERAEAIVVERRVPFSVPGQVLRNDGTAVVVGWTASRERDIAKYRVFRQGASGPVTLVCEVDTAGSCRDSAPPSGALSYWVVAVDGSQEGDLPATKLTTTGGATAPEPPTGLAAVVNGSGVKVSWTASTGATSYRVYRDGIAIGDLLGTSTNTSFTDTSPGTGRREYWVSALNAQGAESLPAGPVSP